MKIGIFQHDNASDTFTGDIVTLNFQFASVEIKPVDKKGDKSPDYRLYVDASQGQVEIGSAWKRTGENEREFLSVSLDGPLMTTPLNTALFMQDDGETAELVWSRQKPKAESQHNTKAKSKASAKAA